jgi:AcrR family transcriptional regulator
MSREHSRRSVGEPTKGDLTRQTIILKGLEIAALEGLGAISIGRLANELRMSKSGLFLHFGSKEKLESAVIEEARVQFFNHVVKPGETMRGIERIWALCDRWIDFAEKGVLPGGCFFSGAFFETAKQHGPIPRQIRRVVRDWMDALEEALRQARGRDQLKSEIDPQEVAFEIHGLLLGTQWSMLLTGGEHTQARLGLLAKLQKLATDEIPVEAFESIKAWKAFLKNRNDLASKRSGRSRAE